MAAGDKRGRDWTGKRLGGLERAAAHGPIGGRARTRRPTANGEASALSSQLGRLFVKLAGRSLYGVHRPWQLLPRCASVELLRLLRQSAVASQGRFCSRRRTFCFRASPARDIMSSSALNTYLWTADIVAPACTKSSARLAGQTCTSNTPGEPGAAARPF